MSDGLNLYVVETVSIFRHRYVVEAHEDTHAADEVTVRLCDDEFKEFSQKHIDECISSVRKLKDNQEYIELFNEDNDYLDAWSEEKKFSFINRIDYTE
jgi:uncharacterized membrane protein